MRLPEALNVGEDNARQMNRVFVAITTEYLQVDFIDYIPKCKPLVRTG